MQDEGLSHHRAGFSYGGLRSSLGKCPHPGRTYPTVQLKGVSPAQAIELSRRANNVTKFVKKDLPFLDTVQNILNIVTAFDSDY